MAFRLLPETSELDRRGRVLKRVIMPNLHLDDKTPTADAPTQEPKTGPSGSTDKTREREKKFDELLKQAKEDKSGKPPERLFDLD